MCELRSLSERETGGLGCSFEHEFALASTNDRLCVFILENLVLNVFSHSNSASQSVHLYLSCSEMEFN